MKNYFLLLITFAFLSFTNEALSQAMKINGKITDSTGLNPVNRATISAVRIKDSLLLSYTHSNLQGQFELNGFAIDTFTLYIEHPSFETKTIYIFGNQENAELNVNAIKLGTKVQELDEIMIYANKNPIYYRGDTLVYVADSFKVGENAVVEDLLKKLPGIKIDKNGAITSQGREISQVLVDGDEFFGSDATIATKNLAAKGIESVEVYETENEDAAIGDDEKIQVLNLKLKDDAKRGYFGKVSGATDFGLVGENGFYEGELLFNKFNKKQKISVFLLSSNTPRSNFGWGDMNKFGLDNERESSGMNMWDQNAQKNTGGVPQTLKAGIYYADRFGKTGKIGFNYSYYNNKLQAINNSLSQYFLSDSSYYTRDSSNNTSINQSHKINFNVSSNLDSLTTFEIKPSISIDLANTDDNSSSKFLSENFVPTFETIIQNKNDSKGINFKNELRIGRKFRIPRREFEFKYITQLFDNQSNGNLITQSIFNTSIDSIDQKKITNNASISHYSFLTYTEPFNKNWKGQVEYLFEYGTSSQNRQTFDRGDGSYTQNVSILSNEFNNNRLQHRGTALLIYETNSQTIIGGLGLRSITINNNNLVLDTSINQQVVNFLPRISYQYKPSMSTRLGLFYTTNSAQPSINDLQPVQDNSNPNRLLVGNPDLKPNYVHNLRINFNSWQAMSGRYIWSGANASLTNNAFANSTTFDNFGRQISKTENVNGNLFANLFAGIGFPVLDRKIEFSPNVNASYSKYSNFINTEENVTKNTALTGGISVELKLDSLEIELSQTYSYNNPVSSLSAASSLPYSSQNYGIDFKWTLRAHVILKFDAEYSINSQRANGYNRNLFIINAEIKKEFGSRQNIILALQANDILNQNLNVQRQLNGNIITDNFTKIISRYFLVKLTYKFNNNKTKEDDFTGWH